MSESSARQLAVAALQAAGEGAAVLRAPDGRPLQAYCLLTGDGADRRVTVYLEQPDGGRTAVLAGDLVWLGAPGAEADAPAEQPVLVAQGVAMPAPEHAEGQAPWSGLLDSAGEPASAQPEPEPEPEPAPEPLLPPPQPSPPEPETAIGFKLYPEPATPVGAFPAHEIKVLVTPVSDGAAAPEAPAPELPATLTVPMQSRHPLAPRAGGSVRLDFRENRLTCTLRGLPSPAALGREPATDRPYNIYRAYLLSQRTGTRQLLGPLTRVWGDNFKLETEGGLPLTRHDAVLVTAEDRSATGTAAGQGAPQILLGSYGQ